MSSEAINAPYHYFLFLRELINSQDIDPEISQTASKKISNQLWSLAPETVTQSILMTIFR